MEFELMASMMCANYGHLEQEVRDLEDGGIDSFHIDIMDGRFVANFAMSLNDMRYIAATTSKLLRIVKKVLVMSVNPGNAGQMFLPYVGKKITKLLAMKEDMGFELYWDGACSAEKILEYAPKGVKGFVLGTTLLFGKDRTYGETLQNIRELRF